MRNNLLKICLIEKKEEKKYLECFVCMEKVVSLHRFSEILGYGVMVTLQILVLSFLVRIQVAQQKLLLFSKGSFYLSSIEMDMFSVFLFMDMLGKSV